jgi:SAM-dependent methyltransferase
MKEEQIKKIVVEGYSKLAKTGCCGSGLSCDNGKNNCEISKSIGYSEEEINLVPEANMGLGCGNPVALSNIKEGDVVLDLGSGAGFDAFLAARKVGKSGKVIGVDITSEMINKAKQNATKNGFTNVEFKLGDIEDLPLEDESVDVIISNCVINLAPNKRKVFEEANRVLKEKGKMYLSDIVLLEEISEEKKRDKKLLCGCVGGALLKEDYLEIAKSSGFKVKILGEDKKISKEQYNGTNLESLKLELIKQKKINPSCCGCCCSK